MAIFSKPAYSNALTNPTGPLAPKFVFGVVYGVNPAAYTVDVYTEGGAAHQGVPIMGMSGAEFNRDVTILQNLNYSTVLMIQMGASYYVMGTVPKKNNIRNVDPEKDGINLNETIPVGEFGFGGSEAGTYASGRLNDYQEGRPIDVIPGDKILSLNNGTVLGLFREGIAKLKASQLCQFILFKYKDLARLVARNFEFFSDFGEITVGHNSSDKVGLHLAGGADFVKETHPSVGKWTVQVWAGTTTEDPSYTLESDSEDLIQQSVKGDVRLYIRVNDAENAESTTFTMDTKGHIVLSMTGDSRESIAKFKKTQVGEDEVKDIIGNKTTEVGKDEDILIQGNSDISVGGSRTVAVVGQLSMTGNEGATLSSSRTITIQSASDINIIAPKVNIKGA